MAERKQKLTSVTEAEWPLLETLWRKSPLSAREVYDSVLLDREPHIQTVRTLLDRMAKKGILRRGKVHGIYVFSPIVDRDQCVEQQSQSFLDRFFGGEPVAGAAYLLRDASASHEELKRLQEMIDQKMREHLAKEEQGDA